MKTKKEQSPEKDKIAHKEDDQIEVIQELIKKKKEENAALRKILDGLDTTSDKKY